MLKSISCHSDYQDFLQRSLPACLKEKFVAPKKAKRLVTAMWLLNCDSIIPSMQSLFPSDGRPARDPISMLRSLILMHLSGFHSITKWVECIQFNDLLLNLSGFALNDSPGVGSFYDFINRLWSDKTDYFNDDHLRVFNSRSRKVKLDASGKMSSTRKPGVVNRLLTQPMTSGNVLQADEARWLAGNIDYRTDGTKSPRICDEESTIFIYLSRASRPGSRNWPTRCNHLTHPSVEHGKCAGSIRRFHFCIPFKVPTQSFSATITIVFPSSLYIKAFSILRPYDSCAQQGFISPPTIK